MSISTALKARQEALRDDREAGFTLIELLVVVIIIGILAAIAIPVYLGVQNNAKDSAVKSDLTNAKTAIVSVGTDNNGALPSSITAGTTTNGVSTTGGLATIPGAASTIDLVKNGWSKSVNTVSISYTPDSTTTPTKWCVDGVSSSGATSTFRVSSNTPVASGTCAQLTSANY